MAKIVCYSRKELIMEKFLETIRKVACYTGACIIAPLVLGMLILAHLICYMVGFMAFAVYTNAPEVSDMMFGVAKNVGDFFIKHRIEYKCGEYRIK